MILLLVVIALQVLTLCVQVLQWAKQDGSEPVTQPLPLGRLYGDSGRTVAEKVVSLLTPCWSRVHNHLDKLERTWQKRYEEVGVQADVVQESWAAQMSMVVDSGCEGQPSQPSTAISTVGLEARQSLVTDKLEQPARKFPISPCRGDRHNKNTGIQGPVYDKATYKVMRDINERKYQSWVAHCRREGVDLDLCFFCRRFVAVGHICPNACGWDSSRFDAWMVEQEALLAAGANVLGPLRLRGRPGRLKPYARPTVEDLAPNSFHNSGSMAQGESGRSATAEPGFEPSALVLDDDF